MHDWKVLWYNSSVEKFTYMYYNFFNYVKCKYSHGKDVLEIERSVTLIGAKLDWDNIY